MMIKTGRIVEVIAKAAVGKFNAQKVKIYIPHLNKEVSAYAKDVTDSQLLIEVMASIIGRAMGLPIPEPIIAFTEDGQDIWFACIEIKHPDLSRELDIRDKKVLNTPKNIAIYNYLSVWEHINTSCVFDEWIANDDRNLGNLIYDGAKGFYLIDHNLAMRLPFAADAPINNFLFTVNTTFSGKDELSKQRLKNDIQSIAKSIKLNLPRELADRFLADYPEFSGEKLEALVAFLQTRLTHLFTIADNKIMTKQMQIQ